MVEATGGLVRDAGRLAEQVGVRGYDAVHLASATLIAEAVPASGESELLASASETGLATADLASCVSRAIGRRSGEAVLELAASGGRLVPRRPRCRATRSTR